MKLLNKLYLAISILWLVLALALETMVWFGLIAKEEPPLVVHLSTWALIIGSFGNIISSVVNKKVDEG